MDSSRTTYLVKKLRKKQATDEEKAELETIWDLATSDETFFNSLSADERDMIRVAILEGAKSKIGFLESQKASHPVAPSLRWPLKIAAAISFIIILSVFWTQYQQDGIQTFQTAYGEHMTVILPDQSTVVLNGNSILRYKDSWGADNDREVWIEGEGFFEVTHTMNNRKFIVHTENEMDVQVLGTKFNVRIRRSKAEVMLQEGKVNLEVGGQESTQTIPLQPGELATLKDNRLTKIKVEPMEYSGWKEYRLFFDQTPLREIAHILEDTYGLQVFFGEDALAYRKLSGAISSQNVDDILKAIEESLNITITRDGRKVVLNSTLQE